jgi:translation initiation factor 1 (eIF-1/SUI1)
VFKKKFASGASVTKEGDVDIQVRSSEALHEVQFITKTALLTYILIVLG